MTFQKPIITRSAPLCALALVFAASCSSAGSDDTRSTASAAGISSQTWVDGNVQSFKPLGRGSNVVYVQGTDGNLWREVGTMSNRTWVDGNVRAYQPMDGTVIYVLGTDGKLWREVGSMSTRTFVASGVSGFEVSTDGTEYVYYVDANSTLWLVEGGKPPKLLAYTVRGFQWTPAAGIESPALYVLRSDGNLWRGIPDYSRHSPTPIETNVSSFRAVDALTYYLERNDTTLLIEYDTNKQRIVVDTKVEFFWSIDGATTFVEDDSFTLWREEYGATHRDVVDKNVRAYRPIDKDAVYVQHMDGNLYYETLSDPACNYRFSKPHAANTVGLNYGYVAAWGIDTYSKTCPVVPASTGYWYNWTSGPIPNMPTGNLAPPLPTCAGLGLSASCCLYVWQPTNGAVQDPTVLCGPNTQSMEAWVDMGTYYPDGLITGSPNGGGCDTCGPPGGPPGGSW
jgi:hypothetical protein